MCDWLVYRVYTPSRQVVVCTLHLHRQPTSRVMIEIETVEPACVLSVVHAEVEVHLFELVVRSIIAHYYISDSSSTIVCIDD